MLLHHVHQASAACQNELSTLYNPVMTMFLFVIKVGLWDDKPKLYSRTWKHWSICSDRLQICDRCVKELYLFRNAYILCVSKEYNIPR